MRFIWVVLGLTVTVLGGFATLGQAAGHSPGLIAFGSDGHVFVQRADGVTPARNVTGDQTGSAPTWAPGGGKLAYQGPNGIWVVNADGTDRRQLAQTCPLTTCEQWNSDGMPVWSPDGRSIAWVANPGTGSYTDVQVISADGSHLRTIAHVCPLGRDHNSNYRPAWSPNGKWLLLASSCYPQIRIVRASNGNLRTRIQSGGDPAWSPNGKTIIFERSHALWIARPDATDIHRLMRLGAAVAAVSGLTWSPNNRRIAYLSETQAGEWQARVVNEDGTDAHTVLPNAFTVDWSPDSKRLAVDSGSGLYTVAADGRSPRLLAAVPIDSEYAPPVWAP